MPGPGLDEADPAAEDGQHDAGVGGWETEHAGPLVLHRPGHSAAHVTLAASPLSHQLLRCSPTETHLTSQCNTSRFVSHVGVNSETGCWRHSMSLQLVVRFLDALASL